MGTSKILIDGVGIDLTADTVAANKMLSGIKAHDSNGDSVTGNIQTWQGTQKSGTKNITANGTFDVSEFASAYVDTDAIPSAYTKLEYIESSGTQYIDSGVIPTENCNAEIDFELTGYTNASYIAFVSAATHMYLVHFAHESGSNIMFVPAWYSYAGPSAYKKVVFNRRYKAICTITNQGNTELCSGGQCITQTGEYSIRYAGASSYTPTNSFYIFARNNGGSAVSYQAKAKLFGLKIITDGILRREFVPAMRNSDSVIGLYDRISDSFFTNIGTGTFTGGALV